ncbi:hypothetical protein A1O3_07407 [Capronia epimyces CBS 606.96]|uniref:Uncharacterized protein n=1 Tax=Capronia epimyces CBS 606.96 TaxID=1182542 RepID=W9YFP0_9EURO|nr:uncharacterized protein A1O3_07407 [Capronia epimyces CBS 606.96]EXJ81119.1 hypothetical protein A1O3_07407 [Capronia epimyces CBS 606.96]
MVEIPILVSTPGLQTVELDNAGEYFQTQPQRTAGEQAGQPTTAPAVAEAATEMVTQATQTAAEDEDSRRGSPKKQSPSHSRSESRSGGRSPTHHSWAESLRQRLASPHSRFHSPTAIDASGRTMLAPGKDAVQRPTTPAADLYKGQSESNFGMTFEHGSVPHILRAARPKTCAYSYEDQKHRMLMDWVERRR